jgi:hypothetical protein
MSDRKTLDDYADQIDAWHEHSEDGQSLHEYLGLTWEQYQQLVQPEAKRYSWSQPCCDPCFMQLATGRHPVRLLVAEHETCVYCGHGTDSGIYVRVNPHDSSIPDHREGLIDGHRQ